MLQAQIAERLVRTVSGGITTDEDRWDYDFVMSIMDSMLATAKQKWITQYRRIPSQWFASFTVLFDSEIQDDDGTTDYRKFPVPSAIVFPQGFSAINVGSANKNFYQKFNSWTDVDSVRSHRLFANSKGVLIADGFAYVWAPTDIDRIFVSECVANLNDLDTFNPDFDDYRVTDEIVAMAEQEMTKKYLVYIAQKKPDLVSNGKEEEAKQPQVQIPGTR